MKPRLRRFVLWSSVPPIVAVYNALYWALIWLVLHLLRRHQSVAAIYLCRGCAKNDFLPGVSDIDFIVVTTNDSNETQSIQSTLRRLSMITSGLIEYYPRMVQTQAALEHRWRTSPMWQYRFHEGKRSWKLLHGEDILSILPPLTEAQRIHACYAEMSRWWILFAQEMSKTKQPNPDRIMHNVVCYKAVSELLNLERALLTGEYPRQRSEGLGRSDDQLSRKLQDLASQRFLPFDARLMDDTLRFLMEFFAGLWNRFREQPFLAVDRGMRQSVDCHSRELRYDEQTARDLQSLREYVRELWGQNLVGVQAVRSAFWDFDDLLLVITIDKDRLPTVKEIGTLMKKWRQLNNSRVFLFLRSGSVIFPLTPVIPQDLHRGLLTPATAPDVFLQLGESNVYWTYHTRWYLADWRSNEQWTDAGSRKQSQLEAIVRGAEQQNIYYPLTVPAIERGIDNGFERPVERTCTHA